MSSSLQDLKNIIEVLSFDSQENLKKFDTIIENIVTSDQHDLVPSLDLLENFLLATLNEQKTLKIAG